MEEIKDDIQDLAGDVEIIKLQNKLEQLDREWQFRKEKLLIKSKNGNNSVPTKGLAIAGIIPIAFKFPGAS